MKSSRSDDGRILIVEDEPAVLRALQINLRVRGYEVTTSTAGQDALVEAARRPTDAVLLDLGLRDLDGTEVIRELRSWSAVPVIVLSGRAGSRDKIGALDAGADNYVTEDSTHYLRFHMARLRRKLEEDPPRPRHLLTEPGMGYRY